MMIEKDGRDTILNKRGLLKPRFHPNRKLKMNASTALIIGIWSNEKLHEFISSKNNVPLGGIAAKSNIDYFFCQSPQFRILAGKDTTKHLPNFPPFNLSLSEQLRFYHFLTTRVDHAFLNHEVNW